MSALLQELVFDSLPEGAVWPFDRTYVRPPHFHGQLECLLITRGTAALHLGTRVARVRDGQLCWILPGVPHVMSGFSPDFEMWVIQLDTTVVASCWREVSGQPRRPTLSPFDSWSVPLGELLAGRAVTDVAGAERRALNELAESVWTGSDPARVRQALIALCVLALRITRGNINTRRPLSISELASCLLLTSPATDRPSAASELGVSEGFLSRSVHRDLGVTFVEHRARTRVAHFLALVQQGESNLLNAALAAGFGSYSQFFRTFIRVSGSPPREYLRAGRRRTSLLVAGDCTHPETGPVVCLPDAQRQVAPL